jgi:asparagine synthetase B (glutamine-hydrolysing)
MCGFLVNKQGNPYDFRKIALRGGDGITTSTHGGFHFMHSLLSITGEKVHQPYHDGDIYCVYNGEIYNHPFTKSDGEVIVPLYKEHGWTFAQHLDGEFAIALYDFAKNVVVFATDTFGTKPMYVSGAETSSLMSGLLTDVERMLPNEIRMVSLTNGEVLNKTHTHYFDFAKQFIDSYDRWCESFEKAVLTRAKHRCFMGLSSGYDSGAISHCLNKHNVDFKAFSIVNNENLKIIMDRAVDMRNFEPMQYIDKERLWERIQGSVDNERYTFGSKVQQCVFDDKAILGLAAICEKGKAEDRRVYISGQGSDEILSDYSPFPHQSELHGKYPEDLKEWKNFRLGCQQSYITKEEHIADSYGIETRYPFLDSRLIQEFLWLDNKLKNASYKAPLRHYLITNQVPFEENMKRGFSP